MKNPATPGLSYLASTEWLLPSYLVVCRAIGGVDVRVPDALVAVQAHAEADVGDDPVRELGLDLRRQYFQGIAAELARGHLRDIRKADRRGPGGQSQAGSPLSLS